MYPLLLRIIVVFGPIMGAGDSQACSSCASYHLVCVPNQDAGHGLVAVPG